MKLLKLIGALVLTSLFFGILLATIVVGSWFIDIGNWVFHNSFQSQLFLVGFLLLFILIAELLYLLFTLEN